MTLVFDPCMHAYSMGMTATTDQNFFTCTQSTKPRMRLNLKPAPTSNCAYQRDRTNCSCRPATRKPTQAAKVCAETYARAEELAGSRRRSRRRMLKANHAWIQPRGPWSSPAGQLAARMARRQRRPRRLPKEDARTTTSCFFFLSTIRHSPG